MLTQMEALHTVCGKSQEQANLLAMQNQVLLQQVRTCTMHSMLLQTQMNMQHFMHLFSDGTKVGV